MNDKIKRKLFQKLFLSNSSQLTKSRKGENRLTRLLSTKHGFFGILSTGLPCCFAVLSTSLLISGCATQVEPEVRTVRVEVPVQVPCRAPQVAIPAWAATGLRKTDSLEVKVRALLAERRQRIGYERLIEAALSACK